VHAERGKAGLVVAGGLVTALAALVGNLATSVVDVSPGWAVILWIAVGVLTAAGVAIALHEHRRSQQEDRIIESGHEGAKSRQPHWRVIVLCVICATTFVASTIFVLTTTSQAVPTEQLRLVWIAEKTTRAPGIVPNAVRDRVREAAKTGSASLEGYVVGERSQHIGSTPLVAYRSINGDDSREIVNDQLDDFVPVMDRAAVGGSGFSLYSSLQVMADEEARTGGRIEVWFSTTLFTGSDDPLVISQLTAADPRAAVQELLRGAVGELDLDRVDLHPVLLDPVGDQQEPLTPASQEWRKKFLVELASGLGAHVAGPLHDSTIAPAWPTSSVVSAVEPIKDPTPHIGRTEPRVRLDNAAFKPDSAELIDYEDARLAVTGVANSYKRNPKHPIIDIAGYAAAYGNADGARILSRQRADTIADLIAGEGVPRDHIVVQGYGFDKLADPNASPQSADQRVVLVALRPS
jgi:outer membrane protein OmpA-like peptidoglycan-associated protein